MKSKDEKIWQEKISAKILENFSEIIKRGWVRIKWGWGGGGGNIQNNDEHHPKSA